MSIIRQTVAPDSWHESGSGGDASIRELNGQLIVYQTSGAQAQVRGLLEQLRAQRAMQIAIEARFLDVVQNFLDEFGVDLDFVFNSGGAGYDRVFTPTGAFFDPFYRRAGADAAAFRELAQRRSRQPSGIPYRRLRSYSRMGEPRSFRQPDTTAEPATR